MLYVNSISIKLEEKKRNKISNNPTLLLKETREKKKKQKKPKVVRKEITMIRTEICETNTKKGEKTSETNSLFLKDKIEINL